MRKGDVKHRGRTVHQGVSAGVSAGGQNQSQDIKYNGKVNFQNNKVGMIKSPKQGLIPNKSGDLKEGFSRKVKKSVKN